MQRTAQPDQKQSNSQQKDDAKGQGVNEMATDSTKKENELDADL